MTPGARIAAAIAVLDRGLPGEPVERVLTNWARTSRFAGSGDRAAVRDLVYDGLRCRRSFGALGGGDTGRGLMLGHVRATGGDITALFSGIGHAPAPPGPDEAGRAPTPAESMDLPDWLIAPLGAGLGEGLPEVAAALRQRAPVFLRVNLIKTTAAGAVAGLTADGVTTVPHPLAPTALQVMTGARRVQTSQAYLSGLVELQDASSQAVVQALPLRGGLRVLDHCAGGGGKTLAMAALARLDLVAHDANAGRMRDLPARALRAGARVQISAKPQALGPYDLILADAPCSGSGSWRRDPQGKWLLTPEKLVQLGAVQDGILDRIAPMVAVGGHIAYATCSLLEVENSVRVARFLARSPGWRLVQEHRFTPLGGGDGFYLALLAR
jgi:16S rRNA (cytosine967-C5)-methyltransferase